MAYDFIPKTIMEISKSVRDKKVSEELQYLFIQLTEKYNFVSDPIVIDKAKPKFPKITRKLQTVVDLKELQKLMKLIKISFGDGSRGGRGVANKGNAFEGILAADILKWKSGEKLGDVANQPIIDELEKQYNISKYTKLETPVLGGKNTKRPISYSGKIIIGKGLVDIGDDVTDVDLKGDGTLIAHLSLKLGPTVTFFNVGILKVLKTSEIKSGLVIDTDGKKLIKLLGIDNARMCQIFNGDMSFVGTEDVTANIIKSDLGHFIQSGIGYGYQMVHKLSKTKIKCFFIDKKYMGEASIVKSVEIHYGGKSGTGKKIVVAVTTPKYIIQLNIRDSTGNNRGYPTRIMCDYAYV